MGKMHGAAAGVGLAVVLAWGLYQWQSPESPQDGAQRAPSLVRSEGLPSVPAAAGAEGGGGLAGAPGIDRNLVFRTDPVGQLLVDSGVIERLNALLDTEHSDHDAQVPEEAAAAGLDDRHAAQALDVLARLRALRTDEKALFVQPGRPEGLEGAAQMLAAQRALRRQHFGNDAERLFGAEEARVARQIQALGAAN